MVRNAVMCLMLAAGAASAQNRLFIAEYQFNAARISAVDTDGGNPAVLFALPTAQWLPSGITIDTASNKLFWVDGVGNGKVISSSTTGTSNTVVATLTGSSRGTSRDAQGRLYFRQGNTLRRVDSSGANLTTLFTSSTAAVLGASRVDAFNGHVYVGVDGQILRFNLDGTNQKIVVRGVSQPKAIGLDIAGGFIYWADGDTFTDFIGRARLDGTEYTIVYDNTPNSNQSSGLIDLLVDPTSDAMYIADELQDDVVRSDLAGSTSSVIYSIFGTGKSPSGLVFDNGEPAQTLHDLDGNGVNDDLDIAGGAPDCDQNGVPDSAQVAPCRVFSFLLDNGSNAASTAGRAVGVPSQWQVFQPFDVPAGGWRVAGVGLDGYTSQMADRSGLTIRIYPDNGTGTAPNETSPLASARVDLLYNTSRENWVYAALPVTIPAGRHWARIEANNPTAYGASVNGGFSGLLSRSRGTSGNFTNATTSAALRLAASTCAADLNFDGVVGFADFLDFFNCYDLGNGCGDVNGDSSTDFGDFLEFFNSYDVGC
jgi:hypothetical protein